MSCISDNKSHNNLQKGILANCANNGRFLIFNVNLGTQASELKQCLESISIDESVIMGLGKNALAILNLCVSKYREFPKMNSIVNVPATHGDLFVYIRGSEAGKVALRSLIIRQILNKCTEIQQQIDGFKYLPNNQGMGHDLTGYEDGTENPVNDDAISAVMREDGSCFVAVQQWQHNLVLFNSFSQWHKDNTIGRRLSDNKELRNAPANSHVNRSDQGTFDINADIVRRSLPWSNEQGDGLMFVAFCENLDRFEVQMRRMAGLSDGVTDALFTFSKVLKSAYFYCPAVESGKLVLK